MKDYIWEEWMSEISGFGGGYEHTCRDMLFAGIKWLEEHPDDDPQIASSPQIFGVIDTQNEDAKDLVDTIVAASGGDCTGAMVHAVMRHLWYIRNRGWEAYKGEMDMRKEHGDKWREVKEQQDKENEERAKEFEGKSVLDMLEESGIEIIDVDSPEEAAREINRRIIGDA